MESANSSKKLITLKEATQKLGVSAETLFDWNEHNILKPTITPTGEVGYTQEQIDQFLSIRQSVYQNSFTSRPQETKPIQNPQAQPQQALSKIITQHNHPVKDKVFVAHKTNTHHKTNNLRSLTTYATLTFVAILVVVIIFGSLQGAEKLNSENITASNQKGSMQINNSSNQQSNELGLADQENSILPIDLRKQKRAENNNLSADENVLSEKTTTSNLLSQALRKEDSVETQIPSSEQAILAENTKAEFEDFISTSSNESINSHSVAPALASKGSFNDEDLDELLAFGANSDVMGTSVGTDSLATTVGGVNTLLGNNSLSQPKSLSLSQAIIVTMSALLFVFIFRKSLVYSLLNMSSPQLIPAENVHPQEIEKILEVDQKMDGTVVVYFQGNEYKISKPELYSDSDHFIERLIELTRPGIKEIDYHSLRDEKIKLTTPLSRIVTRLGFVGLKRELFFPRTSKDGVFFRRYLTENDLKDMNLNTEQIASDLTKSL